MRTSKRLLSLFLALVMIITGSSLGMTAYAADGNQTDQNLTYWNNKTDAEAAFESIDGMLGMVLQLDAVKNLLANIGVTDAQTLSDVVYQASPALLNMLGGLGTLDLSMIGGPTVQLKMSKSDFLRYKLGDAYSGSQVAYYNKWYEPLDGDEEDFLDFYALYGICLNNKDAGGDFGKYCNDTLDALDALFASIPAPVPTVHEDTEIEKAWKWLEQTAQAASDEGLDYSYAILDDYKASPYNGATLADVTAADIAETDGKYILEYYNHVLTSLGKSEITDLAELLYYAKGAYTKYNLIYHLYFDLFDEMGETVDTTYAGVPSGTAEEVATALYGTTDYWNEMNIWGGVYCLGLYNWDSHDESAFTEYFDAWSLNKVFFEERGLDMASIAAEGDISSNQFKLLTQGLAKKAGIDTNGIEMTDAQFAALASAAQAGGWSLSTQLLDYVDASNLSEPVKNYFHALPVATLDGFAAALSYDGTAAVFTDSEQTYFDNAGITSGLDRINTMVYSQALIDAKLWQSRKDVMVNQNVTSEINIYEFYCEYIANEQGEEPEAEDEYEPYPEDGPRYEYVDYAIPDALYVDVVNAMINDFLGILDLEIISDFLGGISTNIDLKSSLTDLWKNLYKAPAETVFELIPLLTVLLDEFILPLILHDEGADSDLGALVEGLLMNMLLSDYTQNSGSDIGIGQLHFDLNVTLPAILHFLTGDQAGAIAMLGYKFHGDVPMVDENGDPVLDEDGNPIIHHYNSQVPKFTNIYIADGIIAQAGDGAGIAALIAGLIAKPGDDATEEEIAAAKKQEAELTAMLSEPIQEVLVFARDAVDDYLDQHRNDKRYGLGVDGDNNKVVVVTQSGLNNLTVALPYLIDQIGKNFIEKYNVDSDWTFAYDGKIETQTVTFLADNGAYSAEELVNTHFQTFKNFAAKGSTATPADILAQFIDLLIGNWINSLTDYLNDMINDEDNDISANLPLLQGLLDALGGFDEDSVITDAFNGLFQLKRSDVASFTLQVRDKTNFCGFSNETGFFLINNIMYIKDGEQRGLVPFIKGIIDNDEKAKADYDLENAFKSVAPTLAGSSKNTSAAGTNYDELLTASNEKAAQKIVNLLDTALSSVLSNAKLNGFTLDSTENLLTGAVSLLSAYFGQKNSNDILVLINDYLYYVCGESTANPNKWNVIGNYPTKSGDVDYKRVYTSANLSNLVIQTYSLLENIIDYLFYNDASGVLKNRDPNMLIADALYGIVSPDAVGIRLDEKYEETKKVLAKKDYLNWNSFKVNVTAAYYAKEQYNTKDYLKFGFKDGDKDAFYDALGESLSGIAGVLGAVLTKTYVDSERTQNWYSNVINPIFSSLANAVGSEVPVMAAADFNTARPGSQLVDGFIRPLGGILAPLYDAPFSYILNLVKGLAGVVDDQSIVGILYSLLMPVDNHVLGLCDNIIDTKLASPILGGFVKKLAIRALFGDQIAAGVPYYNITLTEDDLKDPKAGIDILVKLKGASLGMAGKDILVNIINDLIGDKLFGIKLPSINWKKLATAKNPAQVLLLVYGYVIDTILNSGLLQGIIKSLDPEITRMLESMSAAQILDMIVQVINAVNSPIEVYWTFKYYSTKLANDFTYPRGINDYKANRAVGQLDNIVKNVFPLLNGFGVTDIEGLGQLVNDNLYKNEIITSLAKALYGALTGNDTVVQVLGALQLDVSPAGVAAYLTDSSYGATYSSAASTLRSAKSWDKVGTINWGFKDGSATAQTGFINGLAAALRPLNNILGVLLAENKLDISKVDLVGLVKSLNLSGSTVLFGEEGEENAAKLTYTLKDGQLLVTIRSWNVQFNDNRTRQSVLELDLVAVVEDLKELIDNNVTIGFGTNGYESAIIPLLEAFMCDDIKTYDQYCADYAKAKDNLLINILKPIGGLLNKLVDKPFDTLTAILPNVAYFIDNSGIEQAVGNLLAPITAKEGLIGVLAKNGFDIDTFIPMLTGGKDLGTFLSELLADKLGIEADIKLDLGNLAASNLHDMVIPLVINLLKDKLGITLPEFTWADIAKHGVVRTVASKALNDEGAYTTLQVQANQGEVLVAVLRYVADVLIQNAQVLKDMISGIDAIKNNATLKSIIESIFDQIAQAHKDDIVRAIFYLLCGEPTDSFFDYRGFKIGDFEFSFGELDEDFCRQLAPMLDGLIGGLLEGGLTKLVEDNLYKDDLVAKIATGLYGAVEGVKVGDNTLTNILAMTDIDFSTGAVASLLTNEKYGRKFADAASTIKRAGSWKNVKAENLHFGVNDRDSFLHALTAVLRPLFGVLDVILNDAYLNLFDLISIPGSDGYTSTIVPLLEALGVYNVKTQYQYREDCTKQYDNLLLDILNPLWDKVEDILAAPLEIVADILPNLALFFANDGLIQLVDNLLTPVSALLDALRPIVDVNAVLKAAGLDVPKLLKDKVGLSVKKFDLYDLPGTLKPLVGADNFVSTVNAILRIIKIKDAPLNIELPEIDWFALAGCGEYQMNATSQAATYGGRIAVIADQDEALLTVLRFLVRTINYKDNYDAVSSLVGGLIGGAGDTVAGVVDQVLGLLQGDTDEVIQSLIDLLQALAG